MLDSFLTTNRRITFACLIGGLAYLAAVFGGWRFAYAPETRLQIVNERDGKPVVGANAVLMWRLRGGVEGGTRYAPAEILESVSDKNGWIIFPAWGPRLRRNGSLGFREPVLFLLHKNYDPRTIFNDDSSVSWTPWATRFLAHKEGVVTLRASTENSDKRSGLITGQLSDLGIYALEKDFCYVKRIPKMILAWHVEIMNLQPSPGGSVPFPDDPYHLLNSKFCRDNISGVSR